MADQDHQALLMLRNVLTAKVHPRSTLRPDLAWIRDFVADALDHGVILPEKLAEEQFADALARSSARLSMSEAERHLFIESLAMAICQSEIGRQEHSTCVCLRDARTPTVEVPRCRECLRAARVAMLVIDHPANRFVTRWEHR